MFFKKIKLPKIKTASGFLAVFLAFAVIFNFNLNTTTQSLAQENADILKTRYQQRKQSIQEKKDEIDQSLLDITGEYQEVSEQQTLLSEEVAQKQRQIQDIEEQISETKIIVGQLNQQIDTNNDKADKIEEQMKVVVRRMQRQERVSSAEVLLTSENFGEAMKEIRDLGNLQVQLDSLKEELEETRSELEDNKAIQEDIQEQLEATKDLLASRQAGLQVLLDETNGEQEKYEELLASLRTQQDEAKAQLGDIEGEYLAEVTRIIDQERVRQAAENAEQTGGEATLKTDKARNPIAKQQGGCSFEEGAPLNISPGYFGPVTSGYVSQGFHCGHDGVDISSGLNTDLLAISNGVVVRKGAPVSCVGISCNGGYGNYVVVQHTLPSQERVYALYAHMATASPLEVGTNVTTGQTVGYMGCTGYTIPYPCGVHVHFMLISDTYESQGISCLYGGARCFNPRNYIPM